ncbi:protein BIG GRAIN 1-like A [Olea europaea var. sylvestris]|uniref:Protein BIG GRAIN 1-like B n=1 Tax=Olea europaea subsp. europaea TaxID=158383 RepID=A0A8S0UUD6_OLEEU|nr:protein BIG GRAIN 1-like A [Olea europaea var. sylvestris]CAA3024357.1 Hypothetical predicted protein [Olea europaea subsp. europaea]
MTSWERQRQLPRSKTPSFSSSLLDAIYHSIDESKGVKEQEAEDFNLRKRNNAVQVEEEIESLRRAIRIEKWMENYSSKSTRRPLPSNSCSSTDSSIFLCSETDSAASKSTPKSLVFHMQKRRKQTQTLPAEKPEKILEFKTMPKKVKEPLSPGVKIANFLNSIFSPRKLKKSQGLEDWSSMRKSRSMKETTTLSLASRSCLSKSTSSSKVNKSKRAVRFCPMPVVLDEDYSRTRQVPNSGRIKKNINSFLNYNGRTSINQEIGEVNESDYDLDNRSCTSSDLFELDNIGRVGIEDYQEELPVYGTTNLRMNQAIARGLAM